MSTPWYDGIPPMNVRDMYALIFVPVVSHTPLTYVYTRMHTPTEHGSWSGSNYSVNLGLL
ncbi:hypothetical protein D9619_002430 [Psilocybe cf. subviscida]|uniref:Uncharacterized protein n=1 Tax=Psilocybe cf. subviscida TaxID=2480587 RepID=A0A8H5ETP4_9AGAR|nr:hypothetical protein D9619_002430 [Psilocybe cf. subviscida]